MRRRRARTPCACAVRRHRATDHVRTTGPHPRRHATGWRVVTPGATARGTWRAADPGQDPYPTDREPRRAERRRAFRLGLLPSADPDVRQDGLRRARRAVRGRADRGPPRGEGSHRRRAGRRGPAAPGGGVQEDLPCTHRAGLPAGPARAAVPGDHLGVLVLERRTGCCTGGRSASRTISAPRSP